MTGQRKACVTCKVRPPAMLNIPYCFTCWPGGPVTPPPCRTCGSTENYYSSGLCARCHPAGPGERSPLWRLAGPLADNRVVVDSCPDCLAWGVTRTYGWRCVACRSWYETYPEARNGPCVSCRRAVPVMQSGHCRLCHKQRSLIAKLTGTHPANVTHAEAVAHGQQLFFSGMWRPATGVGKQPYVKKTAPADMSVLRPVNRRQPRSMTSSDPAR